LLSTSSLHYKKKMNKIVGFSARSAVFSGRLFTQQMPAGVAFRRYASADASKIKEHMEIVGSDGKHLGTVDKVESGKIKLTKKESSDGKHHYVDLNEVKTVNDKVHLNSSSLSGSGSSGSSSSGSKQEGVMGTAMKASGVPQGHGAQGGAAMGKGAMGNNMDQGSAGGSGLGGGASGASAGNPMGQSSTSSHQTGQGTTTSQSQSEKGETTNSKYSKPDLKNVNLSGDKKQ